MAIKFSSADARLDCGMFVPGVWTGLTAECWVYLYSNNNCKFIYEGGPGNITQRFFIGFDGINVNGAVHSVYGGKTVTGGLIPLNTWTHVAITNIWSYSGETGGNRLYVNGEEVANFMGITDTVNDPSYPLTLGNTDAVTGNYLMDGILDEVRIWNYKRTPNQIKTYMDKRIIPGPPSTGLFGLWRLDEGVLGSLPGGASAVDLISGFNGIASGTLSYVDGAPIQWGL